MASSTGLYQATARLDIELRATLWRIESKLDRLASPQLLQKRPSDPGGMRPSVSFEANPLPAVPEEYDATCQEHFGPTRPSWVSQLSEDQRGATCSRSLTITRHSRGTSGSGRASRRLSTAVKVSESAIRNRYSVSGLVGEMVGNAGFLVGLETDSGAGTPDLAMRLANNERLHSMMRNRRLQRAWSFLTEPDSGPGARLYYIMMNPLILASVFLPFAQQGRLLGGMTAALCEIVVESLFLLELLVRFAFCPSRWAFCMSYYNLIDFVAILPLAIRVAVGIVLPLQTNNHTVIVHTVLLGVVPIFRLLKLLRRFEKFHLVKQAFQEALEALPVLLYAQGLMALLFAALIYLSEPRENITSLPQALWLTLVTMMTVGYGDVSPVSTPGMFVVSFLMICSVLYMAIPIGIVGSAFNRVWEDRGRLLIVKRTSERLTQWGYRASDISELFKIFDTRQRGELNYREFRRMLFAMKVGLQEEGVHQLFNAFDQDASGAVDEKEFVQQIFPQSYFDMYGDAEDDDEDSYVEGLMTMCQAHNNGPSPSEERLRAFVNADVEYFPSEQEQSLASGLEMTVDLSEGGLGTLEEHNEREKEEEWETG